MSLFGNLDVFWLVRRVWVDRRRLIRNIIIATVAALIIAFSIPRTYESKVVLAPESAKSSSMGSLASLASIAGVNLGGMTGEEDAIYPELYPQIVSSTIFLSDLFDMNVQSGDGKVNATLFQYISSMQKKAWWDYIFEIPGKIKKLFSDTKSGGGAASNVTYYSYSETETAVMNRLEKLIQCKVDVGNDVVTILVGMQDPRIAAQVADRVATQLQEYVTKYRTGKSAKDYEYTLNLYNEAKAEYDKKQSEYARYMDSHALGTMKNFYRIEEDRLRDEAQLAYSVYTQMAQQKELARAKVQEKTPVFSVMQPAVVPRLPAAPSRMFILVSIVFLAFFGHICWIVIEKEAKNVLKSQLLLHRERVAANKKNG